jgi:6-phosphogluconolactonase (cycloisomerase 2 family)
MLRHTRRPITRALQTAVVALSVLSCEDADAPEPRFRETSRSGAPLNQFLYVGSATNRVAGFSIDPTTGALTEIAGSPFTISGYQPQGLHVDTAGKFLYIAGSSGTSNPEFSLAGYAIDRPTGGLTQIAGTPITSSRSFMDALLHPKGHALYFPAGSEGLQAYSIDPMSGALTPVPGQPYRLADDWRPSSAALDASGSTLFVVGGTTPNTSHVSAFAVDATTGALTLQGRVSYTGRAGRIVVHPGGRYAYMWSSGPVAVIGIDNPAAMTITDAAPSPPVAGGYDYRGRSASIDDTGRHAYFLYDVQIGGLPFLAGFQPGYLAAYQIDTANGALLPLPGSPYAVADGPGVGGGGATIGFVMDPTLGFIVVTRFFSPNMAVLRRDITTGELTRVPGSPFAPTGGDMRLGVTFDASGKFAYMPDETSFSISAYAFDTATGEPRFIAGYPLGSRPVTLARIAEPQ